MSQDQKYNGWTNYATWHVNLEMFDGGEWQGCDADMLKQSAEEWVNETSSEGLARDYAMAFLADVNWHEIAAHYTSEEA